MSNSFWPVWLHFAALVDADVERGPVRFGLYPIDLVHHAKTVNHLAENNVLAVEMRGRAGADEKLAPVGVGAQVGHRHSVLGVVVRETFVRERPAENALAALPVPFDKVPALHHKVLDHSVERAPFVAHWPVVDPILARAQLAEVL